MSCVFQHLLCEILLHFDRRIDTFSGYVNGCVLLKYQGRVLPVVNGSPFELPHFPCVSRPHTCAYLQLSNPLWLSAENGHGYAQFLYSEKNEAIVLGELRDSAGTVLAKMPWGTHISTHFRNTAIGIWLRLHEVPVIPPWAAPFTWEDLWEACKCQGVDLFNILQQHAGKLRDGAEHYLVLGFPVPAKIGQSPVKLHWQAVRINPLSNSTTRGFRNKESALWNRDKSQVIRGEIDWIDSEDWSSFELTTRGRLPYALTGRPTLVIGAGAIGSVAAELLVRGGVGRVRICDPEALYAGNLSRHTLTLWSLRKNKAAATASWTAAASPTSFVSAYQSGFEKLQDTEMTSAMLLMDCSGNDDVLEALEGIPIDENRIFVSVSISFEAKHLYLYTQRGSFNVTRFRDLLQPWLRRQLDERATEPLPREGIGCWHPVFPARADQVWTMTALAINVLASAIDSTPFEGQLKVFQETRTDGMITGVSEVKLAGQ